MNERVEIIPGRCKACHRCEAACIASHHDISVKDATKRRSEFSPRVHVLKADGIKSSVRCHQCEFAACCAVCPTGALIQEKDGHISMNAELCIACQMCVKACPYGVMSLDAFCEIPGQPNLPACSAPHREVAVRCDLCREWRKSNGKQLTACIEACPFQALALRLADGTLVEAPKPQKKAVEKGGTKGEALEKPKTGQGKEAVKAEGEPKSGLAAAQA